MPRRAGGSRAGGIVYPLGLFALIALAVATAWLARERLADDWIERELTRRGIEATYTVERIGPRRQILTDIVVGDAARPDATVERIVVELVHRFGLPSVERITVIRPRLYGTWRDGRVSFGELDAFLYGDTGAPPGLPELDVRLVDGRARIATPWGAIGIKAAGSGPIDDGFTGVLAVAAPEIGTEECALDGGSLFGRLATDGGSIAFAGPLRFQRLACSGPAIGIGRTDLAINLRMPAGFESLAASANGHARQIAAGGVEAAESDVALAGNISNRGVALDYAFDGRRLVTEIAKAGAFELDGELRADAAFERFAASGDTTLSSIDPGNAIATRLPEAGEAIAGTLAAPLLARLRRGLSRGLNGAGLQASYRLQTDRGGTTLAVPLARLSTRRGSALATISSARIAWRGEGTATDRAQRRDRGAGPAAHRAGIDPGRRARVRCERVHGTLRRRRCKPRGAAPDLAPIGRRHRAAGRPRRPQRSDPRRKPRAICACRSRVRSIGGAGCASGRAAPRYGSTRCASPPCRSKRARKPCALSRETRSCSRAATDRRASPPPPARSISTAGWVERRFACGPARCKPAFPVLCARATSTCDWARRAGRRGSGSPG